MNFYDNKYIIKIKKQSKKASKKMREFELIEPDETFNHMTTLKEYILYYVDSHKKSVLNHISTNETILENMNNCDTTIDVNGNDNLNQMKKCVVTSIKRFKTQMVLYGCIEKDAPLHLVKKVMDKVDSIFNEELEHMGEMVNYEGGGINEGQYLLVCDNLKKNRDTLMKLIGHYEVYLINIKVV